MNFKLIPLYLLGLIFLNVVLSRTIKKDDDTTWWKTANYYQIYPKSFQDSNGDGVGDLNGITERLSYLNEIGITATWLSPIFTSPMVDNGYDISNFIEIDKSFGTLDDFKKLLAKANELGIKIILDFVPNHSSDQHEWFEKSANNTKGYEDYYVWADGKSEKDPPNNWRSVFRGSAWTYNENRKQFYYHQFYKQQPDLNFRSDRVKEEMKNILKYWLDLGVHGFRIDAVPHIFENKNLENEPVNDEVTDPEDYQSLKHIHTYDQDETFDIIYEWREYLDNYVKENGGPDRILLAEAYSPMDTKMKYYGNGDKKGAQFPFNFLLLDLNENSTAADYANKVNEWMTKMPKGETANWVFGNHDKPRIANRLGRTITTLANYFILSLPGITVTYYGEEIGMENIKNETETYYMQDDRDGERSPMQWNDDISAGFSTNSTPWLPVAPDYRNRNVKNHRGIPLSHLNQFKAMVELREKYKFTDASTFKIENVGSSLVKITRSDSNIEILFNVGNKEEKIEITGDKFEVLLMNEYSKRYIGQQLDKTFNLNSHEVLILKKN